MRIFANLDRIDKQYNSEYSNSSLHTTKWEPTRGTFAPDQDGSRQSIPLWSDQGGGWDITETAI
jgi:hypothetical protein